MRPLARIAFRHGYYDREGGRCPALAVLPTTRTAALLRALRLRLRDEGTGFAVLHDERRTDDLLGYLRRQERPGAGGPQVWARLSFVLVARDRHFVNFTRMPLHTNPSERNFYFTNRDARAVDPAGPILLNPPGGAESGGLVDVVGPQAVRLTPPSVERVQVRDVSGEVVLSVPRCVDRVSEPSVVLDFSRLPEDLYVVEKIGDSGRPVHPPRRVLHTLADPVPIAFVELLFTSPRSGAADAYPVRDLFTPAARVVPTDYRLDFDARACTWVYDVASRDVGRPLAGLRIEAPPPVRFAGPVAVRLADGTRAYRFRSEMPLVLERQSSLELRLLGRRAWVGLDGVLMERLPVASAGQVEPAAVEDSELCGRVPVVVHV